MTTKLFGAFAHLQKELPSYQLEGHYDATLSDFMRDSAWDQTWDVDSLASHLDIHDKLIVDLGVGDGRLIKRLQDYGIDADFVGIDSSDAAYERFKNKQNKHGFSGKFIKKNFITEEIPAQNVDFIYFGSVSINCLTSIEAVAKLFENVKISLSENGRFALSVYTESSIKRFPDLDGILTPDTYITENGAHRIIWRGLKYEAPYLTHNAFIDRRAEGLDPVLCTNYERIWVEEDIVDIAHILGWSMCKRSISHVGDGGAMGYEVATISFKYDYEF